MVRVALDEVAARSGQGVQVLDLRGLSAVVVPLVVQSGRLIVRSLLSPHTAYAPARAVVERCEQLPSWLLRAWEDAAEAASDEEH